MALLRAAGHADFRDARGPLGFTQRQAGGKFSRDEAAALIEQLEAAAALAEESPTPSGSPTTPRESGRPGPIVSARPVDQSLRRYSDTQLAAELQRRGWIVMEP